MVVRNTFNFFFFTFVTKLASCPDATARSLFFEDLSHCLHPSLNPSTSTYPLFLYFSSIPFTHLNSSVSLLSQFLLFLPNPPKKSRKNSSTTSAEVRNVHSWDTGTEWTECAKSRVRRVETKHTAENVGGRLDIVRRQSTSPLCVVSLRHIAQESPCSKGN